MRDVDTSGSPSSKRACINLTSRSDRYSLSRRKRSASCSNAATASPFRTSSSIQEKPFCIKKGRAVKPARPLVSSFTFYFLLSSSEVQPHRDAHVARICRHGVLTRVNVGVSCRGEQVVRV